MTDTGVIDLPLPDATARERIATQLDTNLLVEAGAGSGKTTSLVGRMVALVRTGAASVDEIAAVTFTRKTAGELRERFQVAIEEALREARASDDSHALAVDRLSDALNDIDRAFIGTIHSFCGRLLRERPLEVGLDPGFQELPVEERTGLRRRFWESYLERLARDSDPVLEDLSRAGLRPASLFGLFDRLVENPDVDFPVDDADPPSASEVQPVRDALEGIVDRGWELMDDTPPPKGWDSFQNKIRRLHFEREITGWKEPADLFGAIALLCKDASTRGHKTTLNKWRDKEMGRGVKDSANDFGHGDTPAHRIVDRWYAHRYALAIRLARAAAEAFAEHRLRVGKLDFQDLLLLAARLLRSNPGVRRQLGRRYRRILVDEFQDTDPLQAEIMMLLSSDPAETEGDEAAGAGPDEGGAAHTLAGGSAAGESRSADWRVATPRPGALFVVGDPKQSIYRFRRADIQLYGFVRERFADFGEVIGLSTNFRSRPPIGDLVNGLFPEPDFFPERATAEQAAFERLDTRPPVQPVPAEGVFTYRIAPDGSRKDAAASDDGARIATWIRDRIEAGERVPSDFLILTRGRGQLAVYARALEAYGLPVQVTGAGIGVEDEIRELQVLLGCMVDPSNPVKVVSALVGLFFGLDYERLVSHRLEGGSLDAMRPGDQGHPDVLAALRRLHGWWRASAARPADVFVGYLADELGLLPLAAAGDLGSLRAGALLYALDAVRGAALAGDASLPGALRALEAALELPEAEAPLEPGRTDALRLMNLHQAKGLEGTVVILADPTERRTFRPDVHMSRSTDGTAEGFLRVTESSSGWGQSDDLARPLGWPERESAERRFEAAEEIRLLYVAVTRAREELVVARWPEGRGSSAWEALDRWLEEHAVELTLEIRDPLDRDEVELSPGVLGAEVRAAAAVVEAARRPSHRHATVTQLAKGRSPVERDGRDRGVSPASGDELLRGFAWGSVVHGALAFAMTGPSDEALRAACRNLLVEHQRPLDDHGEPLELRELIGLVRTVEGSDLWRRAQAAERSLAEIAFAVPGVEAPAPPPAAASAAGSVAGTSSAPAASTVPAGPSVPGTGRRQLDLFGDGPDRAADDAPDEDSGEAAGQAPGEASHDGEDGGDPDGDGPSVVLEGVIDLAFKESDGWVLVDFKTDVGTDPEFAGRAEGYRRQVELYADAWSRLTGEFVKERVLFFTTQDRVERW